LNIALNRGKKCRKASEILNFLPEGRNKNTVFTQNPLFYLSGFHLFSFYSEKCCSKLCLFCDSFIDELQEIKSVYLKFIINVIN